MNRSRLVLLFLAAAGCNDLSPKEFTEARDELSCELRNGCGLQEVEVCNSVGHDLDDKCSKFDADKAEACLEQLEMLLDEVTEANDAGKEALCMDLTPDACRGVITATNASGCAVDGRPIVVDGALAVAPVTSGDTWSQARPRPDASARDRAAAEHWLWMARTEHASVAAFARLSLELMALQAPPSLVSRCHSAAQQEIEHATACLAHARTLSDEPYDLGALTGVAPRATVTLEQLAVESLIDGCIGEGSAALRAGLAAERAEPAMAATLRKIHDDEVGHAATSWAIVRWALDRDPSLIAPLRDALASHRVQVQQSGASSIGAQRLGVADPHRAAQQSAEFVERVVWPVFETLACRVAARPVA